MAAPLVSGWTEPAGICVSGSDVLWPLGDRDGDGQIDEYTTSGAIVAAPLISGLSNPQGVAISGSDLFVSDSGQRLRRHRRLNRRIHHQRRNRQCPTDQASLYRGGNSGLRIGPFIVQEDSSGTICTIGEYTTGGVTVNGNLVSGLNNVNGITVSGSDIYVANNTAGTIGEYTTGGVTVNASLISGLSSPLASPSSGATCMCSPAPTTAIGTLTTLA